MITVRKKAGEVKEGDKVRTGRYPEERYVTKIFRVGNEIRFKLNDGSYLVYNSSDIVQVAEKSDADS